MSEDVRMSRPQASLVLDYFDTSKDSAFATCKLCNLTLKCKENGSTYNLLRHMQRKHHIQINNTAKFNNNIQKSYTFIDGIPRIVSTAGMSMSNPGPPIQSALPLNLSRPSYQDTLTQLQRQVDIHSGEKHSAWSIENPNEYFLAPLHTPKEINDCRHEIVKEDLEFDAMQKIKALRSRNHFKPLIRTKQNSLFGGRW